MKMPLLERGIGRFGALIHGGLLLVEGVHSIADSYPLSALGGQRRLG